MTDFQIYEVSVETNSTDKGWCNVTVAKMSEVYRVDSIDVKPVYLPRDDDALGMIMDVCQAIIDNELGEPIQKYAPIYEKAETRSEL